MSHVKRLPYTRPVLRRYGAITKLVQGNNGSRADKQTATKKGTG